MIDALIAFIRRLALRPYSDPALHAIMVTCPCGNRYEYGVLDVNAWPSCPLCKTGVSVNNTPIAN